MIKKGKKLRVQKSYKKKNNKFKDKENCLNVSKIEHEIKVSKDDNYNVDEIEEKSSQFL